MDYTTFLTLLWSSFFVFFFHFFFSSFSTSFSISLLTLVLNSSEQGHFLLFFFLNLSLSFQLFWPISLFPQTNWSMCGASFCNLWQFFIDLWQELMLFACCWFHFWDLKWASSDDFLYHGTCLSVLETIQNQKEELKNNCGPVSSSSHLPDISKQYIDHIMMVYSCCNSWDLSTSQWLVFRKKWKIRIINVCTLIDGFMK